MDNGSFAAAELMVFLGLAGWLVYYQFFSSRRDASESDSSTKEDSTPKDE